MKQDIKQETLDHLDRMIKRAMTKSKNKKMSMCVMQSELENILGIYCLYCTEYKKEENCPLNYLDGVCLYYGCENNACCDGLWLDMYNSKTWREFINNAKKVRYFIEINEYL